MTKPVIIASETTPITDLAELLLAKHRVKRLPIVRDGKRSASSAGGRDPRNRPIA